MGFFFTKGDNQKKIRKISTKTKKKGGDVLLFGEGANFFFWRERGGENQGKRAKNFFLVPKKKKGFGAQ